MENKAIELQDMKPLHSDLPHVVITKDNGEMLNHVMPGTEDEKEPLTNTTIPQYPSIGKH